MKMKKMKWREEEGVDALRNPVRVITVCAGASVYIVYAVQEIRNRVPQKTEGLQQFSKPMQQRDKFILLLLR